MVGDRVGVREGLRDAVRVSYVPRPLPRWSAVLIPPRYLLS